MILYDMLFNIIFVRILYLCKDFVSLFKLLSLKNLESEKSEIWNLKNLKNLENLRFLLGGMAKQTKKTFDYLILKSRRHQHLHDAGRPVHRPGDEHRPVAVGPDPASPRRDAFVEGCRRH